MHGKLSRGCGDVCNLREPHKAGMTPTLSYGIQRSQHSGRVPLQALSGGMSIVSFYFRTTEPGTQLVQGREVVLDVLEGRRSLAPWQVLEWHRQVNRRLTGRGICEG